MAAPPGPLPLGAGESLGGTPTPLPLTPGWLGPLLSEPLANRRDRALL